MVVLYWMEVRFPDVIPVVFLDGKEENCLYIHLTDVVVEKTFTQSMNGGELSFSLLLKLKSSEGYREVNISYRYGRYVYSVVSDIYKELEDFKGEYKRRYKIRQDCVNEVILRI